MTRKLTQKQWRAIYLKRKAPTIHEYTTNEAMTVMMKVTFTFCANRESSPQMAMELFKTHFPGSIRLGYGARLDNFYRVTCTSEEFCRWIYERDQMGFTNRMHQLNIKLTDVPNHFHVANTAAAGGHTYRPPIGRFENPIQYETPHSSGVGESR